MSEEEDFEVVQEHDSVRKLGAALVAVIGITAMAIAVALSGAIRVGYARSHRPNYGAPPPSGTVEQTLIDNTRRGADLHARKAKELERWGWVDRPGGIARIPIERAMRIVEERGR